MWTLGTTCTKQWIHINLFNFHNLGNGHLRLAYFLQFLPYTLTQPYSNIYHLQPNLYQAHCFTKIMFKFTFKTVRIWNEEIGGKVSCPSHYTRTLQSLASDSQLTHSRLTLFPPGCTSYATDLKRDIAHPCLLFVWRVTILGQSVGSWVEQILSMQNTLCLTLLPQITLF